MERFQYLETANKMCWDLLFRATVQRNEPFRTPVISTVNPDHPTLRTVVLRKAIALQRQLIFFTDFRSPKCKEILSDPAISWLFWDARRKIQLRILSRATLHHQDGTARGHWQQVTSVGRKSYASVKPPGTPSDFETDGLPEFWKDGPDLDTTEFAFDNFVVVECLATQVDCLHLHPEGHQRASFIWDQNDWKGTWLVP